MAAVSRPARRRQPIANLFISMPRSVDVDASGFGDDGTGPLPRLKE